MSTQKDVKKQHETESNKKGDDTMSAITQNFSYKVNGKKDATKPEPTISKERFEAIKSSVGKYLPKINK